MARFTAYPNKSKPADSDTLLINDASASANKQILLSGLFAWLKDKFTSTPINGLETTNQTIVGAINELHDAVEECGSASEIEQIRSDVDDLSADVSLLKADLDDVNERIDGLGDGALSDTAIQLLETILNAAVYASDQSANIDALIAELSSGSNVDSITVENGVMTILELANTPTLSNGILSIA